MLIKKVRLKNIKSFGEGEDGRGVTITFERGLNRIGGKNGTGKSSIIEAIGYALFDAEPIRGDNRVQVGTYLVRDGARTGEIDVWIETGDGFYRVERDAGRMIRRWKVIREEDGFSEAEGNEEVQCFLARLFGVAGPERLSELFHSLIGVKQGRFTAYFDCKTSEAKAHFDPLLDVDIFRRCFDELYEPLKLVQKRKAEIEKTISEYSGGIAQLADAPGQVADCETALSKAQAELDTISQTVDQLNQKLAAHEALKQARYMADQKYSAAQAALQNAQTLREGAAKEVAESLAAAEVLKNAFPGYTSYRAAEAAFKTAETERMQRDRLRNEQNLCQLNIERLLAEVKQRRQTIETLQQDIEVKQTEGNRRRIEAQRRHAAYQVLLVKITDEAKHHQELGAALDLLKEWRITLNEQKKRLDTEVEHLTESLDAVGQINPHLLKEAQFDYETAVQKESEAKIALAKAEQQRDHLTKQLDSIRDGVCPFLGERCQQLSPERMKDQIALLATEIERLTAEWHTAAAVVKQKKAALDAAQVEQNRLLQYQQAIRQSEKILRQCYQGVENHKAREAAEYLDHSWPGLALPELPALSDAIPVDSGLWHQLQIRVDQLSDTLQNNYDLWNTGYLKLGETVQAGNAEKEKENAWLVQEAASLKQLGNEIGVLQKRVEAEKARIMELEKSRSAINQKLTQIHDQLQRYPDLDSQMQTLRRQMEENTRAYTLYLQNQPTAAKLDERQARLEKATAAVEEGERNLQIAAGELERARADFDEAAYEADRERHRLALENQGQARHEVKRVAMELARQKERAAQLQNLLAKRQNAWDEFDRLDAQSIVLDKARTILKNSQGIVAQGLASRIQARAQAIYNAMSSEPVQFEWDAADYKLTVRNASGERRFTQLSGGQQMKAAIAMQLALVREFSKAGICAFDEPTYGLDAESRQMLADAIVAVYHECKFDQLFVVSHDASFDDKVEHVVDLKYSAAKGTLVEKLG